VPFDRLRPVLHQRQAEACPPSARAAHTCSQTSARVAVFFTARGPFGSLSRSARLKAVAVTARRASVAATSPRIRVGMSGLVATTNRVDAWWASGARILSRPPSGAVPALNCHRARGPSPRPSIALVCAAGRPLCRHPLLVGRAMRPAHLIPSGALRPVRGQWQPRTTVSTHARAEIPLANWATLAERAGPNQRGSFGRSCRSRPGYATQMPRTMALG
jgi:hypothetical protein